MTGHTPWAKSRERRGRSLGRHRALPATTETPMSLSLAASLPVQVTISAPDPAPREPGTYKDGPAMLADHPEWQYLVSDEPPRPPTEDELKMYAARVSDPAWASLYGTPDGPPTPAAALEPLPKRVPAADAADRQQQASSQQLAVWSKGETLSEDEEPPEAAAEPPADTVEPAPVAEVSEPESEQGGEGGE